LEFPNMKNEASALKIQELGYELKIEDAMSKDIVSVAPDNTMTDVRKILKEKRISGLPVVDNDKLLGMINLENFIKCIINGGIDKRVKDNMSTDIKYVFNDELLVTAISKFEKFGYGRFPVLERNTKRLIGIITKGDIIKCLLKKLEVDYQSDEISKYRASHIFEDTKSDRTTITLRYKIEGGNYNTAGEQSGYLKVNLLRLGIPPKISRRVVIASCEAEMNIIIFTEGGELIVNVEESKIKVNAIDKGPGIQDIKMAMQPGFSTASDWVREMGFGAGMGLSNIEECSDKMSINSKVGEGTNLEFIVNIQNEIIRDSRKITTGC
jgi:CBS domain-containing protein/anti-sigma regulatory factor (Ser/Thr protein kinase)